MLSIKFLNNQCIYAFFIVSSVIYSRYFLQRNYRYFFMFVSSTNFLSLYVFAFCWVNIKKIMDAHNCNIWIAFFKSPASGILIMYTFVVSWFLGGLTAFHLYLIITNQVYFAPLLFYFKWYFSVLLLTLQNVVFPADHIWKLPVSLWEEDESF